MGGDVQDGYVVATSGEVVFLADLEVDNLTEVFHVTASNDNRRLTPRLATSGKVLSDFRVSEDGRFAVYRAEHNTEGVEELYSVDLTNGVRQKLNLPLSFEEDVVHFLVDPTSRRVVYLKNGNNRALYSVPIGGGEVTELLAGSNLPLVKYDITNDGRSLVLILRLSDPGQLSRDQLFLMPITGGHKTKLSRGLSANEGIADFKLSKDGRFIVFNAQRNISGQQNLFSVSLPSPRVVHLNPLPGQATEVTSFSILSDSSRVVFVAEDGLTPELFSVPIDGGSVSELSEPNGNFGGIFNYKTSE